MNPYLAKLRARDHETRHPQAPSKPSNRTPSKPSKPGFEGFEGDRSRRFSDNDRVFEILQSRCPDWAPVDRWQQCVEDGRHFLAQWGGHGKVYGWTGRDLFGLARVPGDPHPSYERLSRYDQTGLVWLLRGRPVIALTGGTAAIETPTGSVTVYRRLAPSLSSQ